MASRSSLDQGLPTARILYSLWIFDIFFFISSFFLHFCIIIAVVLLRFIAIDWAIKSISMQLLLFQSDPKVTSNNIDKSTHSDSFRQNIWRLPSIFNNSYYIINYFYTPSMKLHDLCAASMIFRQLAIWTIDDNERINFFLHFFVYCILHCFDSFELKSKYSIGSGLICSFSPRN